jgi:hypothetical protein
MISMYSQTSTTHNNIQFPKKSIIIKSKNIDKKDSQYYNVYQTVDRIDPNIASSPPNPFVNTLKNRMDVYYLQNNTLVCDKLLNNHRTRTLSIS